MALVGHHRDPTRRLDQSKLSYGIMAWGSASKKLIEKVYLKKGNLCNLKCILYFYFKPIFKKLEKA